MNLPRPADRLEPGQVRWLPVLCLAAILACNAPLSGRIAPTPEPGQATEAGPTATFARRTPAPSATPEPTRTVVLVDDGAPTRSVISAGLDGAVLNRRPIVTDETIAAALLGGSTVYFASVTAQGVESVNPDGGVGTLAFTVQPGGYTGRFLPSSDGSLIAWSTLEVTSFSNPVQARAQLRVAGLDGSDMRAAAQEQNASDRIYSPVMWGDANHSLYMTHEPYGLGGYILFGVHSDLYRVDLETGSLTTLMEACNCDLALSADGRRAAFIPGPGADLTLLDTASGETRVVPGDPGHAFGGGIVFSPNGERLAYSQALGDPNGERFAVYVVEFASGHQAKIISDDARLFRVRAWPVADRLILAGVEGPAAGPGEQTWTVRPDGSELSLTYPEMRYVGVY